MRASTDFTLFYHDGVLDRETDILIKLPYGTVFYADTHTNDGAFGDCYDLGMIGVPYIPGTTGGPSYTQLPPIMAEKNIHYGSEIYLAKPPYNFVFLDGCHSAGPFGSDGDISPTGGAESFGIHLPATDRAFLGWTHYVSLWPLPVQEGTAFSATLFDNLAGNYDLYTACVLSMAVSPRIGWLGDDPTGVDKLNTGPLSPHIIGDPRMKLHGVYGDVPLGYIVHPDGTETPDVASRKAWFMPF